MADLDQVIDMTRDYTPAPDTPGAPTGQGSKGEVFCNVIDLTSDYDNPCFDPAESIPAERATTKRGPPSEDLTWDTLYPQLPEELKHHLEADKPAPSSQKPIPKTKEAPVPPRRAQVITLEGEEEKEEEEEQFITDDLDLEDELLLIELTDQVAAQAAGSVRDASTASEGGSRFGSCPFCERGRRVFTLEKMGESNKSRPVFRCSDSECLYAELLDEEE